jgi:predicted Ser/Thr protein kinase
MRYLPQKFKDALNRMVSFEIKKDNYLELGEFTDFLVNQIPYVRLKNIANNLQEWKSNSLKLAGTRVTTELLQLQYRKTVDLSVDESNEVHNGQTCLYPINIICQLADFLYAYQNKKKVFKTRLKITLSRNSEQSICKLYTNVDASEHSFKPWKDRKMERMIHRYGTACNLHSPFVAIERLNENQKCVILVGFNISEYYHEQRKVLDSCRKEFGLKHIEQFRGNKNHVAFGSSGDDFVKVVDSRIVTDKKNSLHLESVLLNRLTGLDGFPSMKQYSVTGDYEVLVTDNIRGKTVDEYLSNISGSAETHFLFKLFDQTRKLQRNYISHRDLKDSNIIVSPAGDVFVIDFDQAILNMDSATSPDVKRKNQFSPACPCFTLLDLLNARPHIESRIKEIKGSLDKLWKKAARSNSNSPGVDIAYYSYDFGDAEYHGERDFFERWLLLEKNNISVKNKVVVELACNLGFFGAYSALYGAKSVHCFDIDSDIVECAKKLSDIMELDNLTHEVRDLNSIGSFQDLDRIDFMFATSVHFWLKDTTEFDRLMNLAKEVIYEGHEQHDVERDRLKAWGFTEIKSIGITGRLRSVFYARKSGGHGSRS